MDNIKVLKSFSSIKEYADKFSGIENQITELELLLNDIEGVDGNSLITLKYPDIQYRFKIRAPNIPRPLTNAKNFLNLPQTSVERKWLVGLQIALSMQILFSIKKQIEAEISFRKKYYYQRDFIEFNQLYNQLFTYNFRREDYRNFINGLRDSYKLYYLKWLEKELDAYYQEYPLETFIKEGNQTEVVYKKHKNYLTENEYEHKKEELRILIDNFEGKIKNYSDEQIGNEQKENEKVFKKFGDKWLIAFRGQPFYFDDLKGFQYIHTLLQNPNHDIPVLDLVRLSEHPKIDSKSEIYSKMSWEMLKEYGLNETQLNRGMELLDPKVVKLYGKRIIELKNDLQIAEDTDNPEGVESIKQEIQTIIDEIDSLKGLAGRPREIGSTTEKARISVKKCIDKAYEHMSKHSSELEQYFRTHINTGTTCSYNLDSLSPINWAL